MPLAESERDGEEATQWNSNFFKRSTKALECVCVRVCVCEVYPLSTLHPVVQLYN